MPAPTVEGRATVTDGDTVKICRHRIRLHGIDAPESQQYCTLGSRQYACGTNVSIRRGPRDCRVRRVRMGGLWWLAECSGGVCGSRVLDAARSEEHTSELQSLMRISYAVFCLKTTTTPTTSSPSL